MSGDGFVKVARLGDVPPGTMLGVEVGGRRVCLANADGAVYAFQDNCTHKDFPLSTGVLEDTQVECGWHGARFDVRTGRALRLPAVKPLRTYEVKVDGDDILVAV